MFAIWYVFESEDNRYLSQIIKKMAKTYDTPVFRPHITAYGLIDIKIETIDKIVTDCIIEETSFIVEKNCISYSSDFWKSIFIEIKINENLMRINKKLFDSLHSFQKYEFNPHVSLIYKKINQEKQKEIANNLQIKNKIKINGMSVLQFSENINEWKIIRKYDFL